MSARTVIVAVCVVAAATLAAAQTADCPGSFVVSTMDEARILTDCQSVGNVTLTGAVGGDAVALLRFRTANSVFVFNASVLTSLQGLQVTQIAGVLNITANALLANLTGLEQLTSVGVALVILDNPALLDVDALSVSVTSVHSIQITGNEHLCQPLTSNSTWWRTVLPADATPEVTACTVALPLNVMVGCLGGLTGLVLALCVFTDVRKYRQSKADSPDAEKTPLIN